MSNGLFPIYNENGYGVSQGQQFYMQPIHIDELGNRIYPEVVNMPKNTISGYLQQGKQSIQNGVNNTALGWDKLNGLQKVNTLGSALMGLYGAYNAHKQLGLAKDTLNFNKEQYYTNLNNQRKMVNSQLEDRQRRRVAQAQDGGTTTTSVSDYMAKYGV